MGFASELYNGPFVVPMEALSIEGVMTRVPLAFGISYAGDACMNHTA